MGRITVCYNNLNEINCTIPFLVPKLGSPQIVSMLRVLSASKYSFSFHGGEWGSLVP